MHKIATNGIAEQVIHWKDTVFMLGAPIHVVKTDNFIRTSKLPVHGVIFIEHRNNGKVTIFGNYFVLKLGYIFWGIL